MLVAGAIREVAIAPYGTGNSKKGTKAVQQKFSPPKLPIKAHEPMRIAGKLVDADARVEVMNPYTNEVVATVAAADPRQVAEAFKIGNAYKSKLTKYDRQKILMKTAEILARRRDELSAGAEP